MADYGVASRIVVPQSDPIGTMQKLQALQGQGLQNRILGQQAGSKVSMGKAFGAAIGDDGQLNPDKVGQYYTANPDEAQFAPEALAAAQQQRQAQIQQHIAEQGYTKAQLEVAGVENANAVKLGQAFQAGKDYSKNAITSIGDQAFPSLFRSPEAKQQWDAFKGQLTDDPAANAKLVQQFVNTHGEIAQAIGAVQNVDVGGHIVQQRVNPGTGETQVVGQIDKTRGPDAKAALVPTYNPESGKTELRTSGALVGDASPGTNTGVVGQQGPGLGEPEAAAGAVQQVTALRQAAEKAPEVKAALTNIRDTVRGFKPGVKTNWAYTANALATQLGVASPKVKDEAAAQEEFNKLATQFINQQVGALGGTGTDAKLESARHGSPNEFMTSQGIENVTGLMLGLNDAVGAKNGAWEKWQAAGNGPASYPKFVAQFNSLYDPRVFQSQYMDAKQKANMIAGMSKDEKADFQKHWEAAKQFGWIK